MLKATIIITCYNKEKTISRTIDSALNQEKENIDFEVLIVDDCSTDTSLQKIKLYKNKVTLIQNKNNQGVLKSTFVGAEKAKNSILIMLDGDDLLAKNAVQVIINFLKDKPKTALYTKCIRNNDTTILFEEKLISNYKITKKLKPAIKIIRQNKGGTSAFSCFKEDLLKHQENIPPTLVQDYIIPCLLARSITQFYYIDAQTHHVLNIDSSNHLSSNYLQLQYDRFEYFWQCILTEKIAGNIFYKTVFRITLLKKIIKRNKKYKLELRNVLNLVLKALFNDNHLENLKNKTLKHFRERYTIKHYN